MVVTPRDKTKSNPLANKKAKSITKSVVSYLPFIMSLRGAFTPKELPSLKHGTKLNRDNKSVG